MLQSTGSKKLGDKEDPRRNNTDLSGKGKQKRSPWWTRGRRRRNMRNWLEGGGRGKSIVRDD